MGRPREFDIDTTLDILLGVFWSKGYQGASYADLTAAAGVERPALYSAFGNKEALFRKVLARYQDRYLDYFPKALELATAREVVAHLLYSAAELQTRHPETPGCLGVGAVLACSDDAEAVRQAVIEFRGAGEALLRQRLERAKAEGDLPDEAQPAGLAAFIMAVLHGMAVQAKAGFPRETLEAVAEHALVVFPGTSSAHADMR
jgi:AcrR family transcriptional regulator